MICEMVLMGVLTLAPPETPEAKQILSDEGCSTTYYRDSGGWSVGVGHYSPEKPSDALRERSLGKVMQWYYQDLDVALRDAQSLTEHWEDFPQEVQNILVNMSFNLGRHRLEGFWNMWDALEVGDWQKAADEMEDSVWYTQVGKRAERLVRRMRDVDEKLVDWSSSAIGELCYY